MGESAGGTRGRPMRHQQVELAGRDADHEVADDQRAAARRELHESEPGSSPSTGWRCFPRPSSHPIACAWPVDGSLLLAHLPFRVWALDASGRRIPAGRVAFDVFCAVGYRAARVVTIRW